MAHAGVPPGQRNGSQYVGRAGREDAGQGIPDDRIEKVIDLYKSGWSLLRVAEHVGCSGETVRQALLGAGITLRKRWERT